MNRGIGVTRDINGINGSNNSRDNDSNSDSRNGNSNSNRVSKINISSIRHSTNKNVAVDNNKNRVSGNNQYQKKKVVIEKVRFLNEFNKETNVFHTFEPFCIEIRYNAFERIEKPVFGIGLFDEDGFHITGPNTKFQNYNVGPISGRGVIYYKIDKLPLLRGHFYITVTIHSQDSFAPYDIRNRIDSFTVKSHLKDLGKLFIDSRWEHKRIV